MYCIYKRNHFCFKSLFLFRKPKVFSMKVFIVFVALMAVLGTTYQGVSGRIMGGYNPCWPNPCPWGMKCIPRYWGWRRYQCIRYRRHY